MDAAVEAGVRLEAEGPAAEGEPTVETMFSSKSRLLEAPASGREHYSFACLWAEIK